MFHINDSQANCIPANLWCSFHIVSTSEECNTPEQGDIRVMGLTTEDTIAGRMELCFNGQWMAVCAGGWDLDPAAAVCRQTLTISQSGI